MSPERETYVRSRIQRLSDKIERLAADIRTIAALRPCSAADVAEINRLLKLRRSSTQSRKRWYKELTEAGLTP